MTRLVSGVPLALTCHFVHCLCRIFLCTLKCYSFFFIHFKVEYFFKCFLIEIKVFFFKYNLNLSNL